MTAFLCGDVFPLVSKCSASWFAMGQSHTAKVAPPHCQNETLSCCYLLQLAVKKIGLLA